MGVPEPYAELLSLRAVAEPGAAAGARQTRSVFASCVAQPALLDCGAGGALDPVEMEDEAVVLGVQRGIGSRCYAGGRYAPQHERGVHHFHRLIAEAFD